MLFFVFVVNCVIFGNVNSGNIVSIGMMVMFWNSRIEKFVCLLLFFIRFFLFSVCSMIVVEDRVRIMLIIRVIF